MARGSATVISSSKNESDHRSDGEDSSSAGQNDTGSEQPVLEPDSNTASAVSGDQHVEESSLSVNQPNNNDYTWEKKLLETLARVSLASVGGGLVGLSLDQARRQQQQQQRYTYPASSSSSSSSSGSRPRPPVAAANPMAAVTTTPWKRGAAASLAKAWSVSCFLFAAILETTRWISPTTVLYDFIQKQQQQQQEEKGANDSGETVQGKAAPDERRTITDTTLYPTNFPNHQHHPTAELQRVALTVTGDYTIGGSLAGFMVASLAHRNTTATTSGMMPVRPARIFGRVAGVGLGTALGLCAGLVQAAIAVGEVYIQQQQRKP